MTLDMWIAITFVGAIVCFLISHILVDEKKYGWAFILGIIGIIFAAIFGNIMREGMLRSQLLDVCPNKVEILAQRTLTCEPKVVLTIEDGKVTGVKYKKQESKSE